jgi:hypothetical protein
MIATPHETDRSQGSIQQSFLPKMKHAGNSRFNNTAQHILQPLQDLSKMMERLADFNYESPRPVNFYQLTNSQLGPAPGRNRLQKHNSCTHSFETEKKQIILQTPILHPTFEKYQSPPLYEILSPSAARQPLRQSQEVLRAHKPFKFCLQVALPKLYSSKAKSNQSSFVLTGQCKPAVTM